MALFLSKGLGERFHKHIYFLPLLLQSLISFGWEVADQPEVKLGHFETQLPMAGCHIQQAWNSVHGGEVHTLFRPSGAQGLCCAHLDKKFCCSKGNLHHLVLEQPCVLFPKCWMVTVHTHVLTTCLAPFSMDKVLLSVLLSGLCTSQVEKGLD